MNDTPRTDVAQHNMGSVFEPHYVVDVDCSRHLERELVAARAEVVRLKGEAQYGATFVQRAIDAERKLAEAKAQRDLAVEALKIIGECLIMKVKFPENATAAITAIMIKKVLKECGK